MNNFTRSCWVRTGLLVALGCAALLSVGMVLGSTAPSAPDPWPRSQQIDPQTLAKELRRTGGPKPVIVCVGFQFAYESNHISGGILKGPARTAEGARSLEKWARSVPKGTSVVIYCGCCPFKECPNIRPAYRVLRRAGLTHIQVLYLAHDFITDWVRRGYPVERAK